MASRHSTSHSPLISVSSSYSAIPDALSAHFADSKGDDLILGHNGLSVLVCIDGASFSRVMPSSLLIPSMMLTCVPPWLFCSPHCPLLTGEDLSSHALAFQSGSACIASTLAWMKLAAASSMSPANASSASLQRFMVSGLMPAKEHAVCRPNPFWRLVRNFVSVRLDALSALARAGYRAGSPGWRAGRVLMSIGLCRDRNPR